MKIEFHNGHGNQLILMLTQAEAKKLIDHTNTALVMTMGTAISHYAEFETEFENDNDRWEPTKLDILVEGDLILTEEVGCKKI